MHSTNHTIRVSISRVAAICSAEGLAGAAYESHPAEVPPSVCICMRLMSVCVLCGSPVWPSPPVVGPLWGSPLRVGPPWVGSPSCRFPTSRGTCSSSCLPLALTPRSTYTHYTSMASFYYCSCIGIPQEAVAPPFVVPTVLRVPHTDPTRRKFPAAAPGARPVSTAEGHPSGEGHRTGVWVKGGMQLLSKRYWYIRFAHVHERVNSRRTSVWRKAQKRGVG